MISRTVLGTLKIPLLILLCILAVSGWAQTNGADSVVSLEADAVGLSLLSSDDIPTSGTFWIVTSPTNDYNDSTPPYPFLPPNLASDSVYVMANGIFLVDDTAGDAGASAPEVLAQVDAVSNLIVQVQAATTVQTSRAMGVRTMDDSGPSDFTDTNGDGGDFDYSSYPSLPPINTNLLWLQITNVADGFAYLNLNNATDTVYAIFSTTNLPGGWQVETEIWPYGAGIVPFTINTANRGNLFFWAEDWTDFKTNGLPAWWTWQNFGNLDYSASELDSLGSNTLGYDYTNNINPNQFVFSLQVSNN